MPAQPRGPRGQGVAGGGPGRGVQGDAHWNPGQIRAGQRAGTAVWLKNKKIHIFINSNFCSIGIRWGLRARVLAPLAGQGGVHREGEVGGVQERIGAPGRKETNFENIYYFYFLLCWEENVGGLLLHSAALKAFLLTHTYAELHTRCVHTYIIRIIYHASTFSIVCVRMWMLEAAE